METTSRQKVMLRLKAQVGTWVSGEELSRELMLSRTAVWKHVCRLKREGYRIDSVPRKGYLLREAPDRLNPAEIRGALHTNHFGHRMILERETDSTNRIARDLAIRNAPHGTLVLAETQTGGKGRKGRSWFSPAGQGLYLSLILRPRFQPREAGKMTLLTGVALAETLAPMVPSDIVIKWPNDILAGGKKIAGILVENATELDAIQYMIIGVGVNANMPGEAFTGELAGRATSLAEETGTVVDRTRLLCAFLPRLEALYLRAESDGFAPVIESWRKLAAVEGKHVRVDLGQGSVEGILAGIDDDGLLLLRMPDASLRKIHSGDIEYLQPWWGKR